MSEAVTTAEIKSLVKALYKNGATPDEIVLSGMVNLSLSDVYELLGLPQPKAELPEVVKKERVTKQRQRTRKPSKTKTPFQWTDEREDWLKQAFFADYTVSDMASALKTTQNMIREKIKEMQLVKIKDLPLPKIKPKKDPNQNKTQPKTEPTTKPTPPKTEPKDEESEFDLSRYRPDDRSGRPDKKAPKTQSRIYQDHMRYGGTYAATRLFGRGVKGLIKSQPAREILASALDEHLGVIGRQIVKRSGLYGKKYSPNGSRYPAASPNDSTATHNIVSLTRDFNKTTDRIVSALEDTFEIIRHMNLGHKMSDESASKGDAEPAAPESNHDPKGLKSRVGAVLAGGAASLLAAEMLKDFVSPAEATVDPASTDTSGPTVGPNADVNEDDDNQDAVPMPGGDDESRDLSPVPGGDAVGGARQSDTEPKNGDNQNDVPQELKFKADDIEFKADKIKFEGLDGGAASFEGVGGAGGSGVGGKGDARPSEPDAPPAAPDQNGQPFSKGPLRPGDQGLHGDETAGPPQDKKNGSAFADKTPSSKGPSQSGDQRSHADGTSGPALSSPGAAPATSGDPGMHRGEDGPVTPTSGAKGNDGKDASPVAPGAAGSPGADGANAIQPSTPGSKTDPATPPPPAPVDTAPTPSAALKDQSKADAAPTPSGQEQPTPPPEAAAPTPPIAPKEPLHDESPRVAAPEPQTPPPAPVDTAPTPSTPMGDTQPSSGGANIRARAGQEQWGRSQAPMFPNIQNSPNPVTIPPPSPSASDVPQGPYGSLHGSSPIGSASSASVGNPPTDDAVTTQGSPSMNVHIDGLKGDNQPHIAAGSAQDDQKDNYVKVYDYDMEDQSLHSVPAPPNNTIGQVINDLSRQTSTPPPPPPAKENDSEKDSRTATNPNKHDAEASRPPVPDTHHHGDHLSWIPGLSYDTHNIGIGV